MQKFFEAPRISTLPQGHANPVAQQQLGDIRRQIDGHSLEALAERYGSPLFVYSERELLHQFRMWKRALESQYQPLVFAWSYKTNYLRGICELFHREGALAEVVSEMEYDKARRSGVPGKEIILNGPHKAMPLLERAFSEGAQVHLDHLDEVDDVLELASRSDRVLSVGIRICLDAGIEPLWSRFGFHLETHQAHQAIQQLCRHPRIRVHALHCHIGTYILDPAAYARQIQKLLHFAQWMEAEYGQTLEHLDIGGGFPSKAKLLSHPQAPDVYLKSVSEYAEQIGEALSRHLRPGQRPRLILESGRALVDSAGFLLSSVLARKTLPDGQPCYVMDAGLNTLYTAQWYEMRPQLTRELPGEAQASMLAGPLCMNIDVLHAQWPLPPLPRGELLCIPDVGAYNVTQSMQFIAYRPAVVLLKEDGETQLLRRRECLDDVEHCEEL